MLGDFGARKLKLDNISEPVEMDPFEIKNKNVTYKITSALRRADVSNLYGCEYNDGEIPSPTIRAILKCTRKPADNDLSENEEQILSKINEKKEGNAYFAKIIDTFYVAGESAEKRHVIVFPYSDKFYSLTEVMKEYPAGLDPRDFAWMFNRLLEGLFFTHRAGVIHAGLLLNNILISPENHAMVLTEWIYAVPWGNQLKATSQDDSCYPPDAMEKVRATPALDIYMAAVCGCKLLGGNPKRGVELPDSVPSPIREFLNECMEDTYKRPTDAGILRERFGDVLRSLYGKRLFRPFIMPEREKRIEA